MWNGALQPVRRAMTDPEWEQEYPAAKLDQRSTTHNHMLQLCVGMPPPILAAVKPSQDNDGNEMRVDWRQDQ
jgi:hypothetical protein